MVGEGPLTGIRVIEVGEQVSAPFAAKLLADYGADVIKVEPPSGDPARRHGPFPHDQPHPERSALFLYLNTNKRGVTLDLSLPDGPQRLLALAAGADLLIENLPVGTMAGWGLDHQTLAEHNPALVTVSLTPFGETGPYAHYPATNLTTFAMGGQMAVTGDPGRPPLKNGGYQADYQLGLNGFAAATIALAGARQHVRGGHVELSAIECMASVLEATLNTYAYTGRYTGSRRGNLMSATIGLYECADGHLGLHAMPRNLPFMLELMGMRDLLEDERFRTPAARLENADLLLALFAGWAADQTKKETYARAGQMRAPVAYVHNLQDLRDSPQLAARGFWQQIDHPESGPLPYPGPPIQMSDSPWRAGRAPLLGEGAAEWLDHGGERVAPSRRTETPPALPLERVRVLDLTMVWAGPYGARILADMGAEVIKIESAGFYDQLRNLGFQPPETPNAWNRSAYFNHNNRNKLGCTLDLSTDAGKALFLDLVKTADVVVENYRAEVMDRLGLGYEALRAVRPDIILVSMPGHGKSGPERDYVAYGTNIEQLSGLVSLSGYLDGGPQKTGISYGDPMSGTAMAGAVAAALLHRERTGHGQNIEIAQRELLTSLIGEYIVAHGMNGRQPPPLGNRHPFHAPHGVYQAAGAGSGERGAGDGGGATAEGAVPAEYVEPWVAIACETDEQWRALCRVIGREELASDARYAAERERYARQDELDTIISAWTAAHDKWQVAELLRAAGVPCGPVLSAPELLVDRHLRARGFFEQVTHADAGTWPMEGPIYRLSELRAHIRINAPRFGEHTDWALGHLLGLPEVSRLALDQEGITGSVPNMAVHQ